MSIDLLSCYDFVVVGSGLAGLSYALKVADHGSVLVVAKEELVTNNSWLAQGGIAAVTAQEDSLESHIRDTLIAGGGLCNENVVRTIVEAGPERIQDLIRWGVRFDLHGTDGLQYSLHKEGGHSSRRILHIQDHTGKDIHHRLLQLCAEHPNITLAKNHFVTDLIINHHVRPKDFSPKKCLGVFLLKRSEGTVDHTEIFPIFAKVTVLACGGAGKVYKYTSNWSGATGDGIAMAYRAGARVANLEFMQFHPTCLYHPNSRNFLISEALRGEGGELINRSGEAFLRNSHPLGSLAPRDIVARGIDGELKRSGEKCVFLDMTHHSREFLQSRFPDIFNRCMTLDIDMSSQPIPVVPAAHYLCGGVLTDTSGRTEISGLLALGETACTGLHGANRLASNSLLECICIAHNAATWSLQLAKQIQIEKVDLPTNYLSDRPDPEELIMVTHLWEEIRNTMWNYVGIVRSNRRLYSASARISRILSEYKEFYGHYRLQPDILELRNIAIVADLTVRCALSRKESRGIHFNLDYPYSSESQSLEFSATKPQDTILTPGLVDL